MQQNFFYIFPRENCTNVNEYYSGEVSLTYSAVLVVLKFSPEIT